MKEDRRPNCERTGHSIHKEVVSVKIKRDDLVTVLLALNAAEDLAQRGGSTGGKFARVRDNLREVLTVHDMKMYENGFRDTDDEGNVIT